MPTYEYACQACGNELEVQQRITEPSLKTCPTCGKDSLERLISGTAFILKGGGWYKDGYGSASAKPRTENDRADRLTKAIGDDKKKGSGEGSSGEGSSGGSSGGEGGATPSSGGSSPAPSSSGSTPSGGSTPSSGGSTASAA